MFTYQQLLETLKFGNYICYKFITISQVYNESLAVEYNETGKIYLEKLNSLGKTKYNQITILLQITVTISTDKLSQVYEEI